MRVAFVAEYPASPERVVGGVQATVRRLATAMAARADFDVHVVSLEGERTQPIVEELEGVRVHRLPMPKRFGNVTLGWMERRDTVSALRRIEPDIAHAHVLGPPALGTADSGVPWVATAHGIQTAYGRLLKGWVNRVRAWSYSTMERSSLRRARHLIVISPYVLETFAEELRGVTTHAIDNPVEERFFGIKEPGDARRILVSGRVVPLKDPVTVLEAAATLARENVTFSIDFAGPADDPSYVLALEKKVSEWGLKDRVRFLGSLSPARLAEAMRGAGLLLLASHQETASLAIMEAMAAGRPVIASDAGGNRTLVEAGRTGWIVPPRDPAAMALALREALADPAEARSRGAAGKKRAEARFRVEVVVDKTLEVYRQVLSETRAKAA